jgi:hypothetical protein
MHQIRFGIYNYSESLFTKSLGIPVGIRSHMSFECILNSPLELFIANGRPRCTEYSLKIVNPIDSHSEIQKS